jgi:hypothetical protein
MFSGRTLLFLGLGLFLCLTTLSTTAAGLPRPAVDFPLPVDSYHDQQIPSVFGKLTERIQREPLNLVATIIFFGAIVHTFMAARFRKLAHNYQQSYDAIEHLLHTTDGPANFGEKHDKLLFRAHPGIWIDGQGHCYCPRCSAKEIKIAKVDSRILSSGGRIKMVGHIRHSSDQRQLCSDIRRFERENLTAFAAEPFNIRADVAEIRRLRWKTEYLKRQRRCMLQQVRGLEAEQPKLAFYPLKQGRIR